jgi:hypothetical protein
MSGLVELYETYEGILKQLKGEGYLHGGNDTPYTRDQTLMELTTKTTTRLHMYPDVDFAVYTNEERQRYELIVELHRTAVTDLHQGTG